MSFHHPRNTCIAGVLALGVFSSGALAAAHGGAATGPDSPLAFEIAPFIAALVVFAIVFGILARVVWPKILGALDEREAKIKEEIEDAERARSQANAALQQYEKALAEARNEASRIIDQTKGEQRKLADELRAKTEAEMNSLRDSARRDIESAKKAAVAEIYEHMATTATGIASRILQRELSADDQKSLVEDSLSELQNVHAN